MTEKKLDPSEFISEGNRLDRLDRLEPKPEKQPEPPEFISEATRIQIRDTGSALDTFTGRTLTREDLEAYDAKAAETK